ncbi:MAG: hypothetical protein BGP06_20290 [Rhizobiales bacterium 65-9]|nr:NAD(P)-dependent oxidoreductase [Hyphomicrobiales bacterium]OJY39771.1 MAG: hypothetical protein BGP06_20290 [Rhizobiales bacterium 65-9]
MRRIGFIGAGNIGRPMAERLMERGFDLLLCDINPATREAFAALGARVTAKAADCAAEDAVILMVANDDQLTSALFAEGGLFDAVAADAPPLVLVMSTVMPESVQAAADTLRTKGARVVDAPVSGGAVRARRGQLSIMTGGDDEDIAAAQPILDALADVVHRCGAVGAGQVTKIINNLVGVTNLFLFAEAMQIGERLGLDLSRLAAIMEVSSGRNNGTRDWEERKALYRWNAATPETMRAIVEVTRKDLRNAVALAQRAQVSAPMLDGAAAAHAAAASDGILARWRELGGMDQEKKTP